MNRRIKKKLKTKVSKSMFQFDPHRHEMVPTAKTYHGIKLERKKVHDAIVWLRHVTYHNDGYSYQLQNKRKLRKGYTKAFNEKMKHHELPQYLIGVDMCESADQKESRKTT